MQLETSGPAESFLNVESVYIISAILLQHVLVIAIASSQETATM